MELGIEIQRHSHAITRTPPSSRKNNGGHSQSAADEPFPIGIPMNDIRHNNFPMTAIQKVLKACDDALTGFRRDPTDSDFQKFEREIPMTREQFRHWYRDARRSHPRTGSEMWDLSPPGFEDLYRKIRVGKDALFRMTPRRNRIYRLRAA